MAKITYDDKSTLNPQPGIANENKVTSGDMNEIKTVVNGLDDNIGTLSNLNTTVKTDVVSALNECNTKVKNNIEYSTTETVIGTWVDNKPIYRKCFYISSLPNATTITTDFSIPNVGWVTKLYGVARNKTNYNNIFPLNGARPQNTAAPIGVYMDNYIKLETGSDRSGYEAYVIVEYTKTTD